MAVLNKELQNKIDELVDQAYEEFQNGQKKKSFSLLTQAWKILPLPKEQWKGSFSLCKYLFDDYLKVSAFENAKIWLDQLRIVNERHNIWLGVYEFHEGKYYFKLKDYPKAKEAFEKAFEKSEGREFKGEDPEYLDLLQNPEKYMTK